jgi:membrane protease YdiL (CAAX protease family)
VKAQFPSIAQAVFLTIAVVVLQVTVVVPMVHWPLTDDRSLADHPLGIALANTVAFGVVLLYALGRSGAPAASVFHLRSMPAALVAPVVVTTLGVGLLLSDLDNVFRYFVPLPEEAAEALGEIIDVEASLLAALFVLVVVAPVTEELLFRGAIFRGLVSRYRFWPAALLSAALVAFAHLNPWQFLTAMCLGVLFAWYVYKTASIVPALIGHALHNGSSLAVGALPVDLPGFTTQLEGAVVFQPLWLDALGLALAAGGLMWFRRTCASRTHPPAQ